MEKYQVLSQYSRDITENSMHESGMSKLEHADLEGVGEYSYPPPKENRRLLRPENIQLIILYTAVVFLSLALLFSMPWRQEKHCIDPSLGIWSPAQYSITYKTIKFDSYFTNRSPYTQPPSKELDKKWEDLYSFGLSSITPQEASHLNEPTAHLPHDENTYIVTLGVFHQLHCVNHLRKALYPDEYTGLWEFNPDGSVKRDTVLALHWDHCIDILRQTLMCHADITPMPFYYRQSDDNVYSVLAASETCRDFERVREWAVERQIVHWRWNETGTRQVVGKG
ncbi:hypothetical protein IFR05_002613 [Cadophora sp. M221]|nr:hypothetical protein IFR05_002613 [Cadophora sp. M221]